MNNVDSKKLDSETNKKKGFFVFVTVFGIVFFLLFKCSCGDENEEVFRISKQLASIQSQGCVKELLKSPSSAKFPILNDKEIMQLNDSTFIIESYVDSKNSFGVEIRSDFSCKVIFNSNGYSRCEDIKIE